MNEDTSNIPIRRSVSPLRLHRTVNGKTRAYELITSVALLTDGRVKHYDAPAPQTRRWDFPGSHTGAYGSAVKLCTSGTARVA